MSKRSRNPSSKEAANLSLRPKIREIAEEMVSKGGYSSLSVFVEELIRSKYESIFGPSALWGTKPPPEVQRAADELRAGAANAGENPSTPKAPE